jgi:hypothetical protein
MNRQILREANRFGVEVCDEESILNCVYSVLDVVFREDESRVRLGMRRTILPCCAILRSLFYVKIHTLNSGFNKRLKAGCDDAAVATLVFGHAF